MSEDKFLRIRQVIERTGLSRPSIYAMIKMGAFPASIALEARAVGWLESEIDKWMEARKSAVKTGIEAKPGQETPASIKRKSAATAAGKNSGTNADTPKQKSKKAGAANKATEADDCVLQ